jgi:hypothetical protein
MKMAELHDGAIRTNLANTRNAIWQLKTESTEQIIQSSWALKVYLVPRPIGTKFRRLPHVFAVEQSNEAI